MKKESLHHMNCFELLGIAPTKDKKIIRHAYASQAKKYHLETDAEEIERLKDAYDIAMAYTKEVVDIVNVIEDVGEDRDIAHYIREENAIPELPIEEIRVSFTEEEKQQEEKNVFYKSKTLWENYEKIQYERVKELPGIEKIRKGIDEGHIFSFEEGKEYVMSPEFLHNQYEEFYIQALLELFAEYGEKLVSYFDGGAASFKHEEALAQFFLPFAFMYGWDKDSQYQNEKTFLQSDGGQEIQDFIDEYFYEIFFHELEESSLFKKEGIIAFSINAHTYHALTMAYKEDDKEKQDFFWNHIRYQGLDYDELPFVKVKNDFSFWPMLAIFLETHKDFNIYVELEQKFNLSGKKNDSQKHIFQSVVDSIEGNASISIDIIHMMAAKENQVVELRKKKQISGYLQENRLDYSAFVYFYELYYFVPERTEEEQKVIELLQEYTEFESYYWEQVEQEFEEEEEIG